MKGTPRGWCASTFGSLGECVESSLESRYFRANVVYLLYTAIILHLNYVMYPHALEQYSDEECAWWSHAELPPPGAWCLRWPSGAHPHHVALTHLPCLF